MTVLLDMRVDVKGLFSQVGPAPCRAAPRRAARSGTPVSCRAGQRSCQCGWVRRTPDGRCTLAILTDDGWAKVTRSAPGHADEVRRLVFDPLTKAQQRQLGEISRRILRAIDPDDRSPDDRIRSLLDAGKAVSTPA
jgi:hypothetical protein